MNLNLRLIFGLICVCLLLPEITWSQQPAENPTSTSPAPVSANVDSAVEDEVGPATEFLRVRVEDDEPQSLETAVVRYATHAPSGATVDLIGAVHVGEASYYRQLNQLFDEYEVVLYELVAPEGMTIPRGGPKSDGFNPVALLQDGAKNMLGLELQLEKVDYTKPHFVRADLTPKQMADKMSERGDTAFTLALDALAGMMRQQNLAAQDAEQAKALQLASEISLADMFGNPLKMKRVMAQQFALEGSLDQSIGRSLSQLLIVDRNAAALRELQKQLAAGKKKIAIFYGAAHLPDFEQHLINDFGLHPSKQSWMVAWDLTASKQQQLSEPVEVLLNILKAIE